MTLVISLDVAELAATRFATSPLGETIRALQLLAKPDPPAVNLPWVRWARARLDRQPLGVPRLWPLVVTGLPYYPEFLIPAPAGQWPAFADELTRLAATPAPAVRASLHRVFGDGPWPDSAVELSERPQFGQITAELTDCHDRLIAPHWARIRAVLDADIAYRTGLLARGGARELFRDMHPDLKWAAGTLTLADADTGRTEFQIQKGPDGLVLMPTVFGWPDVSFRKATSTQTTMMYPARGTVTVWHAIADPLASGGTPAEHLLGAARARLLSALRSPATTTVLARQLGVTPSAISQHLRFLYRGGLLNRQRSGRAVLYQVSELGLACSPRPPQVTSRSDSPVPRSQRSLMSTNVIRCERAEPDRDLRSRGCAARRAEAALEPVSSAGRYRRAREEFIHDCCERARVVHPGEVPGPRQQR